MSTAADKDQLIDAITKRFKYNPSASDIHSAGVSNFDNNDELAARFPSECLPMLNLDSLSAPLQEAFKAQYPSAFSSSDSSSTTAGDGIDLISGSVAVKAGNGIDTTSGNVDIKIDLASDPRLTVGINGLKLDNITQTEIQAAEQSKIDALATKFSVITCAPLGSSREKVDCCIHKAHFENYKVLHAELASSGAVDPFPNDFSSVDCNFSS